MAKSTKTNNVTDVINNNNNMGDTLKSIFDKTLDIKVAHESINAYRTAISAAKAQLIYKKLTGTPGIINFFENKK
jgi:hypothetical protein